MRCKDTFVRAKAGPGIVDLHRVIESLLDDAAIGLAILESVAGLLIIIRSDNLSRGN